MRIETTRDFRRPRARVLAHFRTPEKMETVLAGMGIEARRLSGPPAPSWDCVVTWRDAPRRFTAQLTETVPEAEMRLNIASDLAEGTIQFDFADLPEGGCRVIARADITARTLTVRLALQALRLARGRASERLGRLVAALGRP